MQIASWWKVVQDPENDGWSGALRIDQVDQICNHLACKVKWFFNAKKEIRKMDYPVIDVETTGTHIRELIRESGHTVTEVSE